MKPHPKIYKFLAELTWLVGVTLGLGCLFTPVKALTTLSQVSGYTFLFRHLDAIFVGFGLCVLGSHLHIVLFGVYKRELNIYEWNRHE